MLLVNYSSGATLDHVTLLVILGVRGPKTPGTGFPPHVYKEALSESSPSD